MDMTAKLGARANPPARARVRPRLRLAPEHVLFAAVASTMAVGILSPLVMLVYGSLTSEPLGVFGLDLTLANYERFFTSARLLDAFWNTVKISVATTIAGGGFGLLLAWLVVRTDMPGARGLRFGLMAPFFLSPVIGALAWITLTGRGVGPINRLLDVIGLPVVNLQSVGGIVFIMSLYYAPYMFIFASSALENMDSSMEEAGAMSGLNRRQIMASITIPLMAPAILSGLVLTFVSAMGQFGVPALLGTPINYLVMTTYIFDLTQTFPTRFNLAAALAMILLAVCGLSIWAQRRMMAGRTYTTVAGKGARHRAVPLGAWRWPLWAVVVSYVALTAVLPVAMLAYVSLIPLYTGDLDLGLLTLRNYVDVLTVNQAAQRAIVNTLVLAVGGAALGVAMGLICSYIVLRTRAWYRNGIDYVVMLPAAVPSVVYGIAMLWTYIFVPLPIYGSLWLLLIGYVVGFIPFAYRAVYASLSQVDKSLEEAATMVGAGWMRRMREVTVPLVRSGMLAGWMLLFVIFVRELAVSVFLYSPGSEVLPVLVYNKFEEGQYPTLAAMAMLQVVFIATVVFIVSRVFRVDVTRTS